MKGLPRKHKKSSYSSKTVDNARNGSHKIPDETAHFKPKRSSRVMIQFRIRTAGHKGRVVVLVLLVPHGIEVCFPPLRKGRRGHIRYDTNGVRIQVVAFSLEVVATRRRVEVSFDVADRHDSIFYGWAAAPVGIAIAPMAQHEMARRVGNVLGHGPYQGAVNIEVDAIWHPVEAVLVEVVR